MKKLTPFQLFAGALTLYALLTLALIGDRSSVLQAVVIYGVGLSIFYIWRVASGKKVQIYNTLISLAILFLLIHPWGTVTGIISTVFVVVVLFAVKVFFAKRQMIINPVVLTLLIASIIGLFIPALSDTTVSWWGAAFWGSWSLLFLAPVVFIAATRFRKLPLLLSYCVSFLVLSLVFVGFDQVLFALTTGTMYFLAGVMLLEPKTSPAAKKEQIAFGIVAAVSVTLMQSFGLPLSAEIAGLALVNIIFFIKKKVT